LDDAKSAVLQAQARITQRQLETEKVMSQISDTTVQMGAASSTAGSLQQQVDDLARDIAQTEKRVADLEADVSKAKNLIDNANAVIAEKSQQVSTLDRDLNEKTAQATMLAGSVAKLGPQADASEQTVTDMQAALDRDYIPLQQFQEQETRLNELTQIVTERTKLIRELRADLEAIEGEEQLMVRMCLADAQCKAAMGERLGVEE
jgi:chromosome segregation ATPase